MMLKSIFTGPDGVTYDYSKVLGAFGIIALCFGEIYHLIDDNIFNAIEFGTSFAAILTAACGGVWLKSKGNDMPPTKGDQ